MRRRFFVGSLLALAAPAIIRTPGLLMPVKPLPLLPLRGGTEFVEDGVPLRSAELLELQAELSRLHKQWTELTRPVRSIHPLVQRDGLIAFDIRATQAMLVMERMQRVEAGIARRMGNTSMLPFEAAWWREHAREIEA